MTPGVCATIDFAACAAAASWSLNLAISAWTVGDPPGSAISIPWLPTIQTVSRPTRRAASRAARPEMATTWTSPSAASAASVWRVAGAIAASCGRGAIGDRVPSISSRSTSGSPASRSASAGDMGRAGVVTRSHCDRLRLRLLRGHDLGGAREDGVEPIEDRRVVELPPHPMHSPLALFGKHLERRANGPDEAVDVERVDQHRAVDLLRRSGEAAEDQNAPFVELAGDE